jgi:AAA family ATP:ADP antiporter
MRPERRATGLERLLSLFTEVQAGEGPTVLLLAVDVFLILLAYYIIKPVREALILAAPHGAEIKSYTSAGQALLLLLVLVPAYARLAGKVPRRALINIVNIFFIANLVLFYVAIQIFGTAATWLAVVFFLWVGIFNLMVPTQFWSLANDVYTPGQGKRLFVIVAFGASAGAAVGGVVTKWLIGPLGLNQMLLVSAAVLVMSLLLLNVVEAKERGGPTRASAPGDEEDVEAPLSKEGAFRLVLRTRYLLLIALLMLALNWVNTTGEFILGSTVGQTYKEEAALELGPTATEAQVDEFVSDQIGEFYAGFFTWVNVLGLLMQLFLVSRILKYIGVRYALLILPCISLGAYTLLAVAPVLEAVRWAKTAENSTDYSLQNTVRQALFLPTTREQKYKAKQAIDTFFWRGGDVLSALLVYFGLNWLHLPIKGFSLFNVGMVLVWLCLAWTIGRRYQQLVAARESTPS